VTLHVRVNVGKPTKNQYGKGVTILP